jgi:decaprenylphospho-beta-D-ribofuranose 2-oxidase
MADHASRSDSQRDPLAYAPRSLRRVPPVAAVGRRSINVQNELRYRAAPLRRVGEEQTISAFFHPLDAVSGWNRLYGRGGFVQWQCAVPDGTEAVVATVLTALQRAGAASYVTVLKRFGAGNAGPLSFPIAGWTLAVDLPAAPSLGPTLDALDGVVAEAGGRIYLAKDARLDPALVATMYPRLDEWRAVRDRLDPTGALQSDLGRRLALIGAR